MRIIPTKTN